MTLEQELAATKNLLVATREEVHRLEVRCELFRAIAAEARPFISDAGSDEDHDARTHAIELLEKIDAIDRGLQMSANPQT